MDIISCKMKMCTDFHIFLILIYSVTSSGHELYPTQCENFTDRRAQTSKDVVNRVELRIPTHLTNERKAELKFFLEKSQMHSPAWEYETQCKIPEVFNISLNSTDGTQENPEAKKYPFQEQRQFVNHTFFTFDGYLHRSGHYWHPNDYCVQSLSDETLTIKSCKLDCAANLSNTYLHSQYRSYPGTSRVCIPKCCGVDEVLSLTDSTCRRLNNTEPNYFLPYLHLRNPIWYVDEDREPHLDKYKVLVRPFLNSQRNTWNSTHGLVSGSKSIWRYLHFVRNTKLQCQNYQWKNTEYDNVNDKCRDGNRYDFRVEVHPGMAKLKFLTKSRKWVEYQKPFCVDGMDGWGTGLSNQSVNQVVMFCVDNQTSTRIGAGIRLTDEKSANPTKYFYMIVILICCVVLLTGFLMYVFSFQRLNFSGSIIASYLLTVALLYFGNFVNLAVSLSEYAKNGDNAVQIVSSEFESWYRRIGWFCVGLGAICHYFYLAQYFWLCALNGATWKQMGNISREYWAYGMLGWGVPSFMIFVFCLFERLYNDPWSEAIVPDYGVESCNVASWSAGYYVHLPIGLILCVNFMYILAKGVLKYKSGASENSPNESDKADGVPYKFFAFVCFITTFAWVIALQEWIRAANEQPENWARPVLLSFGAVWEALLLVHICCMNEVVLGLVSEKVPWTENVIKFLVRYGLIWKGSGLIGHILEDEEENENNDTVVIDSNELLPLNDKIIN